MPLPRGNRERVDELALYHGLSVNAELLDRAIRHAHWIESFKARETTEVLDYLDQEVIPDLEAGIVTRLSRAEAQGFDQGPATTQRLLDMRTWYRGYLDEALRRLYREQKGRLIEYAAAEATLEVEGINRIIPAPLHQLEVTFVGTTSGAMQDIVTSTPLEGKLLRDWWSGLHRTTVAGIDRQIKLGVLEGETAPQISRRVFGYLSDPTLTGPVKDLRRHSQAITRTAVTGIGAEARERTHRENDDLVKGVLIVATLDARTTEICMGLDGKVFEIDRGPRPPFHVGCRTTTSPVLKGLDELGITTQAINLDPLTRASFNGEVPGTTTYASFLPRQPAAFQDEALGKTKADIFRRGIVPIERFSDRNLRPLTVEELLRLERRIEQGAVPRLPRALPGEIRST